jgi:2-iminobutanoate/2-iminopropanoate deaminase
MRKTVSAPEVKKPARAALTGGVAVGDQVFLSGQMAYNPEIDGISADMGAAAQTRVIMDNIGHLLTAEGMNYGDIVRVTIFLTDLGDLRAMNEVYSSYVTNLFRRAPRSGWRSWRSRTGGSRSRRWPFGRNTRRRS